MNFLWKVTNFCFDLMILYTWLRRIYKCCRAGVKVGLVCTAIKFSLDYDVWSLNTGKGADNYSRLQNSVLPGLGVFSKY
uniref:DUF5683 domain-containing protein n=1 Tax=Syphacia muris TaxID=451379 RepID=A0A0N5AMD0_9BILA